MAQDPYVIAVDFGSDSIKVAVAKQDFDDENNEKTQILSLVEVESAGIKRGVITNMTEATSSLNKAFEQTENVIGLPVRNAIFGINGLGVSFSQSQGLVINTKQDGEIGDSDIERLIEDSRKKAFGLNDNEILHIIPKNYRIDNQAGIKNPIGMVGKKLEANILIISIEHSYLRNLSKVIDQAGVAITSEIYTPLATGDFLLSLSQKKSGTVLVDIGAYSTSYIVWENEEIISTGTIPIGSAHITQDLAVGLQTTIEMADEVKKNYLDLSFEKDNDISEVEVHNPDLGVNERFNLNNAQDYARPRVEEIFFYLNKELRKIGKAGKLAGGAVLIGGGSNLKGIVEVAKQSMHIPVFKYKFDLSRIEFVPDYNGDPVFINAIALVSYFLHSPDGLTSRFIGPSLGGSKKTSGISKFLKNILPWS